MPVVEGDGEGGFAAAGSLSRGTDQGEGAGIIERSGVVVQFVDRVGSALDDNAVAALNDGFVVDDASLAEVEAYLVGGLEDSDGAQFVLGDLFEFVGKALLIFNAADGGGLRVDSTLLGAEPKLPDPEQALQKYEDEGKSAA